MNKLAQTLLAIFGLGLTILVLVAQCSDTDTVRQQNEALKEYESTN